MSDVLTLITFWLGFTIKTHFKEWYISTESSSRKHFLVNHFEKQTDISSKIGITTWCSNSTNIPERNENMWTEKLVQALFIVAKNKKQKKNTQMSVNCWLNKWISQMWATHTIECYSAIKKKRSTDVHQRNLKTSCWVREASLKRLHVLIQFMWNVKNRQNL